MATDDELPREHIRRILLDRPEACVDVSVELLRSFSESLGNIIGDDGFRSLLFRAARRVSAEYPWLEAYPAAMQSDPDYAVFRQCFEARSAADTQSATTRLFTGLIDILASLVGAHLTNIILENAVARASARKNGKEQDNG